jgi:diaminopimelate decarboxylase
MDGDSQQGIRPQQSLVQQQHLLPGGTMNVTMLPTSVTDLVGCVGHEIKVIEDELNRCYDNEDTNANDNDNDKDARIESLEDAIDDGFMCVDLRVLERKLEVWHRLFSPSLYNKNSRSSRSCSRNNTSNDTTNNDTTNNLSDADAYTVTPFFAVKCNPDPLVVEWLARSASHLSLPLGFDCASIAELELAKAHIEKYDLNSIATTDCNTDNNNNNNNNTTTNNNNTNNKSAVPTTRIVYANPQRAEADLMRALELFSTPHTTDKKAAPKEASSLLLLDDELWLTLDGVEEVYKIAIARKRFLDKHNPSVRTMPRIKIILRIWVPDGHSQVPLGEKFGMQLSEIDAVLGACLEHGILARDIIGVSFHCGSGCESVETYLEALEMGRTALAAMDDTLLQTGPQNTTPPHRCWLLDIGGGFPGLDGLYGDDGRFAVTATTATSSTAMEEKKDADGEPPTTTVADIAVAVRPILQSFAAAASNNNVDGSGEQPPPLTIIAEPGRYFVEGAFALASRIYQKQMLPQTATSRTPEEEAVASAALDGGIQINESASDGSSNDIRVYRIPHGVQGVFKDVLLCGESFVPQPLPTAQTQLTQTQSSSRQLYLSRVLGPSGDDSEAADVVCDACWLPELEVGDWLVFDRMGAYTLSIASRAGRPVMRYVMGGEEEEPTKPSHPQLQKPK